MSACALQHLQMTAQVVCAADHCRVPYQLNFEDQVLVSRERVANAAPRSILATKMVCSMPPGAQAAAALFVQQGFGSFALYRQL